MKQMIKHFFLLVTLLIFTGLNAQQSYDVIWTDLIRVKQKNNKLKNTAAGGWGNSGAASLGEIPENTDGWLEATVPHTNKYMMIGLSSSNCDASYTGINYAIYAAANSNIYIYETGRYRWGYMKYCTGDVFRVERKGNKILYKRN